MKKILLSVLLSTGLFAYGNNQYQNNNPDVLNLYCLVTSFAMNGVLTHVNDRNRKQYHVDKYIQFIATQSYFYPQGESHNPAVFSRSERMQGTNSMIDLYVNDRTNTYNYLVRESEYKYHLMIQVFKDTSSNSGTVQYDCTTNP